MTDVIDPDASIPAARVRRPGRLSLVWLVPIVAAAIGAWLIFDAVSKRGPTITILFDTAEGLEAGRTKIRYKDVVIGNVESIQLAHELKHVIVTATLIAGAEQYLTDATRFWVVRPRLSVSEISGLSTLLSGAYITLDPVSKGEPTVQFRGLDKPPTVTTDDPGRRFRLRAPSLGSLDVGSPVYFRQVPVGQVVGYELDKDGSAVRIGIFIKAPFHALVNNSSRFWNASGIRVNLGANGVKVATESLVSLAFGGIAFETPTTLDDRRPVGENETFSLYDNRESIHEQSHALRSYWLLKFDGSVHGLEVGAPVELRGIRVGRVVDIRLRYGDVKRGFSIPVLIELEPESMALVGPQASNAEGDEQIAKLVASGLAAQLKTGSLLTGQLYVELAVSQAHAHQTVEQDGAFSVMPTIPAPLDAITTHLLTTLQKIEKLPLEKFGNDAVAAMNSFRELAASSRATMEQVDKTLVALGPQAQRAMDQVQRTLEQVQSSLHSLQARVDDTAPLQYELTGTMKALTDAALALRDMADYLQRHPESVLRGKSP